MALDRLLNFLSIFVIYRGINFNNLITPFDGFKKLLLCVCAVMCLLYTLYNCFVFFIFL